MPDLVLWNGRLWTQDLRFPDATAIAIRDGHILAVGSDDEIRDLARPNTESVDLRGRRVLPGLTDAHFHFKGWALARRRLRLAGLPSLAAAQEAVGQAAQSAPPGQWIRGQGWNETNWPERHFLSAADLDAVAPDHPVFLHRSDLHLATASSMALRLAGITADTPDPEAGVIDRDGAGQPTGVLRDKAMDLVSAVAPKPGDDEIDLAMRDAIVEAHRLGLTGIHDFRSTGAEKGRVDMLAWQRLWQRQALDLRVWAMIAGESLDAMIALGLRTGFGDDRLRTGGIKLFADGSLGARTAWMLDDYQDGGTGLPIVPMAEIADKVARADAHGISVGIHAIGDQAIHELLDVFTEVLPASSPPPFAVPSAPHRIEHMQHSRPGDLKRLGELGLVSSVQPLHVVDDMGLVEWAVGDDRARWTYAFRTMMEGGAVLALGSDAPVADPNPFLGIHAAVTRQRPDGTPAGGWFPEQCLTVAEAVYGYTMGPAIASGQTDRLGSLSPGKLADCVVLDRDIFAGPPAGIAGTQAAMTVFDGRIVHCS
ncbi:MAG: amidohydrolase [Chloroflexota bacterium]|nr:amidohydrolase [Chloroflexota bacterium]